MQLWLIKEEISFKNRHFLWDSLCEVCSLWNISFSVSHVYPILFSLSARLSMYILSGVTNSPVYMIFTHIIITHRLILFYFALLFSFYYHKVFRMIYSSVIKSNRGNFEQCNSFECVLNSWPLGTCQFIPSVMGCKFSSCLRLFLCLLFQQCDLMDEGLS